MERYLPEGALRDDGLGCTLLKGWDSILCPTSLGDPESPGAGGVLALVEEGGCPPLAEGDLPRPLPVLSLLSVNNLALPGELPPELAPALYPPAAPAMSRYQADCEGTVAYLGLAWEVLFSQGVRPHASL